MGVPRSVSRLTLPAYDLVVAGERGIGAVFRHRQGFERVSAAVLEVGRTAD
ncbi:MAG: hypothetical protein SGJ24_08615 [Chloroflexota bacterium]|nr:hypothetical protein [Chloroflexota bacterium]